MSRFLDCCLHTLYHAFVTMTRFNGYTLSMSLQLGNDCELLPLTQRESTQIDQTIILLWYCPSRDSIHHGLRLALGHYHVQSRTCANVQSKVVFTPLTLKLHVVHTCMFK